jgi:hypothetical protein
MPFEVRLAEQAWNIMEQFQFRLGPFEVIRVNGLPQNEEPRRQKFAVMRL